MTEQNLLFPGRPNYTGPTAGMFGMLHHAELCESSHNVMERVAYVRENKPHNEIKTRLHNMIFLGGCLAAAKRVALAADYAAKRVALYADYAAKRDALYADYKAKRDALAAEIVAYIKSHIPDCAWNGQELVFPMEA